MVLTGSVSPLSPVLDNSLIVFVVLSKYERYEADGRVISLTVILSQYTIPVSLFLKYTLDIVLVAINTVEKTVAVETSSDS